MSFLPLPFKKFIPKIFKDDPKTDILANKVDTHIGNWKTDILKLKRFIRADECPEFFINELGILVSADIKNQDPEAVRRRKVSTAVETHKIRSTFQFDAKIKIDNVSGLSPGARILNTTFFGIDEWILTDGDTTYFPSAFYWGSMGSDGIDDDLGLGLLTDGTEFSVAGNVYIDAHEGVTISTLTAAEITQIETDLADSVPAYMAVYIGYIDGSGDFQTYTVIQ